MIPVLRRFRKKVHEIQASLSYKAKPCLRERERERERKPAFCNENLAPSQQEPSVGSWRGLQPWYGGGARRKAGKFRLYPTGALEWQLAKWHQPSVLRGTVFEMDS
jgi:hypothetical protein